MLQHLARTSTGSEPTADALHDELREAFLPWLLIPHGVVGVLLAIFDPLNAPPPSLGGLGALMLLVAAAVLLVRKRSHDLAAWLLCVGSLGIVLVAQRWFPDQGIAQALVLPVVMAALTVGRLGTLLITLASAATGTLASASGAATALPWVPIAVLCCVALYLILDQRSQRTVLIWAWQGYTDAQRHLEDARDRQVELKEALEDLALVTAQTFRLNEMLSAARQAVEEARKAKEEFVANVSHELRTPLNMIIGFSDMILESPEVYGRRIPAALLADVAAIKRNSYHLASLVDDVLDLSEAETGHMQLLKEWVSLNDLASEAAEAVSALFAKKGLTLHVDLPLDLVVSCDRTRIRQVLLNLLSNAGRFTERGGCRVTGFREDDVVKIQVSDTGPGIGPDKLPRMFEPFQQGDPSLRRRYGGTGLGLAISRRFVELHGGKIWLESCVGQGTTVTFSLPVEGASLPVSAPRTPGGASPARWFGPYGEYEPRDRTSAAPAVEAGTRAIVLEDGTALRDLLDRYTEDVQVVSARSPDQAAEFIAREAAAVLLINQPPSCTGPGGVGPDAPDLLPSFAFDVPIIWCWVPEQHSAFQQMGVQDYLVKPIAREELLKSMAEVAPEARTVLLVDDDAEARQLFRRMLASISERLDVLIADDGESALRIMRDRQPDLVLLDLVMPNMDGFAVLETKAQEDPIREIPVIVISATDPQRQPIVAKSATLSRQQGLSARDLASLVGAATQALRPRFGAPTRSERSGA